MVLTGRDAALQRHSFDWTRTLEIEAPEQTISQQQRFRGALERL